MNLLARWRRSLSLRVVASSSFLILVIVIASSTLLINQVQSRVVEAKVDESLIDAVVGLEFAEDTIASFGPNIPSMGAVVDSVVAGLSRRSGQPAAYEVLLISNGDGPERSTNAVLTNSVSDDLLVKVFAENSQQWTYSNINYGDSRRDPAIAIGAPLTIAQQQYGLFLLYPTTQQQQLIDVVQSSLLSFSALLAVSLILVVFFLTRRITDPIKVAANTAQKIASGLLDERLKVSGEDEVARWSQSFNLMTATLEQQIKRLEELSVMQQRFVSDVSHELRTPVTTVRLAADLLYSKRGDFPVDMARAAELLQGELDRFESMLSDLLEISRIDSGASPLELAPSRVSDLVERVRDSIEPVAVAAGVKINVTSMCPELSIAMDSRRVERALRNLITNAIKHSGSKSIDVKIADDKEYCQISVIDYGIGLTNDSKQQVFQRFWRADPSRARDHGGSGLGLSIALEDIKQHNGEIRVNDSGGSGVTFVISIPKFSPQLAS